MFGKIDYINLLPFHIYLKKYYPNLKQKKSVPSTINRYFENQKVDAAFISSIKSRNKNCFDLGIVAKSKVQSVLVKVGQRNQYDTSSNTSNILAQVLNIQGEIIIGDRALQAYLEDSSLYQDLASLWWVKTNLPFVFARFCINSNKECYYKRMIAKFQKIPIKIPQYIFKDYAKKTNIPIKNIVQYLNLISYKLNYKEKKSLNKFLNLSGKLK